MVILAWLAHAERVVPGLESPMAPEAPVVSVRTIEVINATDGQAVPVPVRVLRRSSPLVRVELDLDTGELWELHRVAPSALAALSLAWGEGTALRPAARWREDLRNLGIEWSIRCGSWRCALVFVGPVSHTEQLVSALAEVTMQPVFPAAVRTQVFRKLRREWVESWRAPGIVHDRTVGRMLWPDGHRAREDIEPRRTLRRTLTSLHARILTGARASLSVVGDVEPAAITKELLGAFAARAGPPDALSGASRSRPVEPIPIHADQRVLVDVPTALQARVSVVWDSPANDGGAWALAFRVLAVGQDSRLHRRLREREGLTYAVDGQVWQARHAGRSSIELAVDGERLSEALRAIEEELVGLAEMGITEAERSGAVRAEFAEARSLYGTAADVSHALWVEQVFDLSPGELVTRAEMYQHVSREQVNAAARKALAAPRLWVVSGSAPEIEPALEAAGWEVDRRMSVCAAAYGGRCP